MTYRKHKGNRTYKINWTQRTPVVVESHLNSDGSLRKVVTGGEVEPRRAVYTTGQNPTATLNAFLFGRDRTNIQASITEVKYGTVPETHPIPATHTFRRSPRSVLRLMAAVATLSMGGLR